MRTIAVIGGGDSSEYEISVKSALAVEEALKESYEVFLIYIKGDNWYYNDPSGRLMPVDKNQFTLQLQDRRVRFDAAFIAIHGKPGENGQLQGYFDMLGIPYTGCDAFSAALTFNKHACKLYLKEYGIPMARSLMVGKNSEFDPGIIAELIGYPCFIKPNDSGSSFGVSRVEGPGMVEKAIDDARKESSNVIIESFMQGTEVACGVVKVGKREIILPVTEIVSKNSFFDYEAKYTPGMAEEITPARIPEHLFRDIQSMSSEIYDYLGCSGLVRVDFIIVDDKPLFLEINSIPGMGPESIIPRQIKASGLTATEVYSLIIEDLFA